jgi:hypothetical protein
MNKPAILKDDSKFAALAIRSVRVDIARDGVSLVDGTQVLTTFPLSIDPQWKSWLGLESKTLKESNLVLVRIAKTGFPPERLAVSDDINEKLAKELIDIFSMLRLLGTIEYANASLLRGHVQAGRTEIRHFGNLERFHITRGCLPWMIREPDLQAAVALAQSKAALEHRFPEPQ